MYDPSSQQKIQKDIEIKESLAKRKMIRTLTRDSVLRKMTFRSLGDSDFRDQLLNQVRQKTILSAIGNYIGDASVSGTIKYKIQKQGYDWYSLACQGKIRDIIVSFLKIHEINVGSYDVIEGLLEDVNVRNLDIKSIESSVYNRVSAIRDYIEVKIELESNPEDIESQVFKYLLSAIRLSMLISDISSLSCADYNQLIINKNKLIVIEQDADYVSYCKSMFKIKNLNNDKGYYDGYRLSCNHFDLLEDFADEFYKDIVRIICNTDLSDSEFLTKLGELAVKV
ncbi:hypothetical protein ACSTAT_003588 [Vibrio cholerae]